MKEWRILVPGFPPVYIKALTRAAARYEAWRRYTEAGYKCSLVDFRAQVKRAPAPI